MTDADVIGRDFRVYSS